MSNTPKLDQSPAEAQGEPVGWAHIYGGQVTRFLHTKQDADTELERLNREYPADAGKRSMRPLVFGDSQAQPKGLDEGKERAEFERVMPSRGYGILTRDGGGYASPHVSAAWVGWQARAAQAPAPVPATGDANGRCDGLRSDVHGRVAVGGYAPGALADHLWASHDVMSLNAELGLTMDQLVQITQAALTAAPCAAAGVDHTALLRQALETIVALTEGRVFTAEWAGKHGATIAALRAASSHHPVQGSGQ